MFAPTQSKSIGKRRAASAAEAESAAESEAPHAVSHDARESPTRRLNWDALPLDLLLKYRDEINARLPPTKLSDMDLESEMLLQYHTVRALQTSVLTDDDIPPNQRAQVANSVTASLNKLADLQQSIYSSERFKAIENTLIRHLSLMPEDAAQRFMAQYAQILRAHARQT